MKALFYSAAISTHCSLAPLRSAVVHSPARSSEQKGQVGESSPGAQREEWANIDGRGRRTLAWAFSWRHCHGIKRGGALDGRRVWKKAKVEGGLRYQGMR
jgi:hypothetical protein